MGKYDDIIDLPHHISDNHTQMPMEKRAAQFAPFAALSGHNEAIHETIRQTDKKAELSEDEMINISKKILKAIKTGSRVAINYFIPDKRKEGGTYTTVKGIIRKLDEEERNLIMERGEKIFIPYIKEIQFKRLD